MAQLPQEGKLLYHITSINNIESIFQNGILPRQKLSSENFINVADPEILKARETYDLESVVPFHFFASTPFAGSVQQKNPTEEFIYITIQRSVAQKNGFKIIPSHPLTYKGEPLIFEDGISKIDWDLVNKRDYSDHESKEACMAECLSSDKVPNEDFFTIFVKSEESKKKIIDVFAKVFNKNPNFYITVSPGMFKSL